MASRRKEVVAAGVMPLLRESSFEVFVEAGECCQSSLLPFSFETALWTLVKGDVMVMFSHCHLM